MIEITVPRDPCPGCPKRKSAVCSCPVLVDYLRENLDAIGQLTSLMLRKDYKEVRNQVRIIDYNTGEIEEYVEEGGEFVKKVRPIREKMTEDDMNARRKEILRLLGGK